MIAVAAAFMLAQSAPQVWSALPRMHVEPGDRECVAYVSIENRNGNYNQTDVLSIPGYGDVAISYRTVGGHNAAEDDQIAVEALPPGLGARPMQSPIKDGDTMLVCLFEERTS